MPRYFRVWMGVGGLLAVIGGQLCGWDTGIWLVVLTLAAGILWLLIHTFARCPKWYRLHFLTAIAWTAILLEQTTALISKSGSCGLIAYLALFVSGSVWIHSWRQLWERWRTGTELQKSRSRYIRLSLQTLWGPLALVVTLGGLNLGAQLALENAIVREDTSAISYIRSYGLGDVNTGTIHDGLREAIREHNTEAVSIYLSLGTSSYLYNAAGSYDPWKDILYYAADYNDPAITELILDSGVSPNHIVPGTNQSVLSCVSDMGNRAEILRLLKRHGAKWEVPETPPLTP